MTPRTEWLVLYVFLGLVMGLFLAPAIGFCK
jgi:hypothetical protein